MIIIIIQRVETFPAPFLPLTQVFPRRHFPSCNDPIHCCKRYTLTAFTVSLFIFELSISRTKASIRNRFFLWELHITLQWNTPFYTSNDFLYLEWFSKSKLSILILNFFRHFLEQCCTVLGAVWIKDELKKNKKFWKNFLKLRLQIILKIKI